MHQYFIEYQIREDIFIKYSNKIKMGGSIADIMGDILAFEADRHAIIITINSFGTEMSKDDCAKLNPDSLAAFARAEEKFKRGVQNHEILRYEI